PSTFYGAVFRARCSSRYSQAQANAQVRSTVLTAVVGTLHETYRVEVNGGKSKNFLTLSLSLTITGPAPLPPILKHRNAPSCGSLIKAITLGVGIAGYLL